MQILERRVAPQHMPFKVVGQPRLAGRTGFTGCGNSNLFCHSERSEESLFGLDAEKERFLGAQRASE
jgi:hypothetical protein